jgi:hypothetical protein
LGLNILNEVRLFAYVLAGLLIAVPAVAHHSTAAFDGSQPAVVTGVITKLVWQNPHTYIYMDVADKQSNIEKWVIESESLYVLQRLGWTKDLIKPGQRISSIGGRARNGTTTMRCKTIELSDGRKLPCFPSE